MIEQHSAFSFEDVHEKELQQVTARRREFRLDSEWKDPETDSIGLALSGGGIRSATFSLGIIQQLAQRDILKRIDYLSTVSGGGYIGSWLCSWIRRKQTERNHPQPRCAFQQICSDLQPKSSPLGGDCEPPEITFLRQYSNYLTPRFSVFSADTWVAGAIWLRNSLLNFAFLVAFFASAVLAVRLLGLISFRIPRFDSDQWVLPLYLSLALLLPVAGFIAENLRSLAKETPDQAENSQLYRNLVLLFAFASAAVFSAWLDRACGIFIDGSLLQGIRMNWIGVWPGFVAVQLCSYIIRPPDSRKPPFDFCRWRKVLLLILLPPISAFVTAALLRLVAFIFDSVYAYPNQHPWFVIVFGPPLVLSAFALGMVVHIGLIGRDLPESSREWLSRLGAVLIMAKIAWIVVAGASLYGPYLLLMVGVKTRAVLATSWLTTTLAGLFAAKSSKTSGTSDESNQPGISILGPLAAIGPYVFMVGFILAISLAAHLIVVHNLPVWPSPVTPNLVERYDAQIKNGVIQLSKEPPKEDSSPLTRAYTNYWQQVMCTQICVPKGVDRWLLSGVFPLLSLLIVAGGLLAWRVDVNLFSMHYFYRNRLVRCYLGAARQGQRHPNPFTGFDPSDDTRLHLFSQYHNYYGPYPIINAALNVTSGGMLQYQQRQAESFVFTPFFTGFSAGTVANKMRLLDDLGTDRTLLKYQDDYKGDRDQQTAPTDAQAYRGTSIAGGGVSLGMAMGISGAAVNPNMGYHTSTAVAFLLTVFNVRLGWWLGNTLKKAFRKASPPYGLLYILSELIGMANANRDYVNLSDGGHFDNMGIYELVRRRCRYIICCDGEEDAKYTFEGIGNAIRKCRTDFGVDIDLPVHTLRKVDGLSAAHCAVGRIKYSNDEKDEKNWGYLVYFKATLTGDEPTNVWNTSL